MQVKFLGLADSVNQSGDGKLNVLGMFERFQIKSHRGNYPLCFAVVILECDAEDVGPHEFRLSVKNPEGAPVYEMNGGMDVQARNGYLPSPKFGLPIVGLSLEALGEYLLEFEMTGKASASTKFYVSGE